MMLEHKIAKCNIFVEFVFRIFCELMQAQNFTYGELCFLDFCRVLRIAGAGRIADQSFVDLGSGTGVLLAAAYLGVDGCEYICHHLYPSNFEVKILN